VISVQEKEEHGKVFLLFVWDHAKRQEQLPADPLPMASPSYGEAGALPGQQQSTGLLLFSFESGCCNK